MRLMLAASLCLSAAILSAQTPSKAPSPRTETKHVVLTTSASAAEAAPGTRVSLFIDIAPRPNMHVYAPEEKNLLPISLKLDRADTFKAHALKFPKSERFVFEALNETQFGYSKPFRIVQDVTLGTRQGASPVEITGTLEYQACDTSICYVPAKVPVSWTIAIKRIPNH